MRGAVEQVDEHRCCGHGSLETAGGLTMPVTGRKLRCCEQVNTGAECISAL